MVSKQRDCEDQMNEQDRENFRNLFAMFAMMKMTWTRGDEKADAEDCFIIADAMLEASQKKQNDGGISAIKPRRKRAV